MKAASVCKTLESKFQWQCHSVSRACAAASGATSRLQATSRDREPVARKSGTTGSGMGSLPDDTRR